MSVTAVPFARRGVRGGIGVLLALLTAVAAGALATASPADARIIPGRCEYTNNEPTLSYAPNTYRLAVRQVQCELNWSVLDINIAEDGYFGPATLAAVRRFQGCAGIGVDGIVGPQTWAALNRWAASNDWLAC
jgi:peptidoglycan hydrolase-like protein with peptidoglycan-binding domain